MAETSPRLDKQELENARARSTLETARRVLIELNTAKTLDKSFSPPVRRDGGRFFKRVLRDIRVAEDRWSRLTPEDIDSITPPLNEFVTALALMKGRLQRGESMKAPDYKIDDGFHAVAKRLRRQDFSYFVRESWEQHRTKFISAIIVGIFALVVAAVPKLFDYIESLISSAP